MTDEKGKFYSYGKFFETFEDLVKYAQTWPNERLDLEYFKKFLDERFTEALLNAQANPYITNREMFRLLRISTDWAVVHKENSEENGI